MTYPTRYPGAVWRPVRNYTPGGIVAPTRGLIPHVQEGNGSLFGWFDNAASQVSAHLWVSKSGVVEQYVGFADRAWAQAAGNRFWISCECEGRVAEDYTAAQIQRLAEIYRWGMAEFGWRAQVTDDPNGYGLGTHRMGGSSWGGHSCPGDLRAGRRVDILAAARGFPSTPPPSEEDDDMPSPSQWTEADKVAAGKAVADYLAAQMRALVTTDPDSGATVRMADVRIGSVAEAIGLLVLRSSFGMRRDGALGGEVARIADHLGADGALVAWTKSIGTDLAAVRADLARITAGSGGAVDLTSVHAQLDALLARLSSLTLTVTPGGTL